MQYDDERLEAIFGRTDDCCHICHRKLCYSNYGVFGKRGAWEVEHSNARANGGTDRLNNLYAAHITCNREKGTFTTRTARGWNGNTKAPPSRTARERARNESAVACSALFAGLGALAGKGGGAVIGGLLGLVIGYHADPGK
ncbi:MAG: HNH endonuclease [Gemmatimonadaceae bacterium]